MKKFLVWPAILFVVLAVFRVYYIVFPCQSGFFIGGCPLGQWVLSVLFLESLVVYAFLFLLIFIISWRLRKDLSTLTVLLLGVISLGTVFGSVLFPIPGFSEIFTSLPFYAIDFFSKVSLPRPIFFHERYTVLQRLIRLFLFPFLPDLNI